MTDAFVPMSVTDIDLAEPLDAFLGASETRPRLRLLVRLLQRPIGFVELARPDGGVPVDDLLARCEEVLGEAIRAATVLLGVDPAAPIADLPGLLAGHARPYRAHDDLPAVSVVISTRDRAESLQRCLDSLAAVDYPQLEVVVVDNAAKTDATRVLVAERYGDNPRFRYVAEPRPGLSNGRNCGLRAASHEIVAYTDDDTEADRWWIHALAAAFVEHPDAGCVTGLVPTAEIDTPSQQHFDRRVSWSSNCAPRRFTLLTSPPPNRAYPFAAGIFGTGANFAVRRQLMIDLGEFDTLLGAGAPTMGGEDLDAFVRVILDGHALVYQPAAVVWHHHRVAPEALKRQLYGYGLGLSAYATKLLTNPRTAGTVLRRIPTGLSIFTKARKDDLDDDLPLELGITETLGLLAGPAVYLKARLLRRLGRTT